MLYSRRRICPRCRTYHPPAHRNAYVKLKDCSFGQEFLRCKTCGKLLRNGWVHEAALTLDSKLLARSTLAFPRLEIGLMLVVTILTLLLVPHQPESNMFSLQTAAILAAGTAALLLGQLGMYLANWHPRIIARKQQILHDSFQRLLTDDEYLLKLFRQHTLEPDDMPAFREMLKRCAATGEPADWSHLLKPHPDDQYFMND